MTYLPTKLPKLLGLAAAAALGLTLFAGSGSAEAAPGQGLSSPTTSGLPVEQAGYYKRYNRSYQPYAYGNYPSGYSYGYRSYGNGHDEIRELQRLFPSTNWPPSLRYHQY
jgi:hypothetical protein